MFTRFLIAIYLLLTTSAFGTPNLNHPMTLTELVDIALENHPSTRQAWWNAQRAVSALGSAKSAYYPTIGMQASATHGRDFKFINGPNTEYTIFGVDFNLSLLLFDFGERDANVNATQMSLLAANWQVDRNIQEVMVHVLENAYSTLHAQETLKAAHTSLEDAERMLQAAQELNRAGITPISDVYTSQATLAHMKMEFTQQKSLLEIQKGKLAASLGLSADVSLELVPLDLMPTVQKQHTSNLIALAYQQRADLMAKRANVSESLYNLDKACASYLPKLTLSGQGGANHYVHDKTYGAQYRITLNLDIPLFEGFERIYNNRTAYANTKLSRQELDELQLNIALEVLTHSRSLEAAQEMLPDADEHLKNSVKAYESVLTKYQVGKERIAELSNALRQVANARVRYSDVKTRWLVSMANLAYATGTLAPHTEAK